MTFETSSENIYNPNNDSERADMLKNVKDAWLELGLSDEQFSIFYDPKWSTGSLEGLYRLLVKMVLAKDEDLLEADNQRAIIAILEQAKQGDYSSALAIIGKYENIQLDRFLAKTLRLDSLDFS